MSESIDNQLISDVARDLIAQVSPQELPLFRATSTAYFKNPKQVLKDQQKKKEDMLGFSPDVAITAIFTTPAALEITKVIVEFLLGQMKDSDMVKNLFKKFRLSHHTEEAEKHLPPPLTHEQLAYLRKIAYEKALQSHLPASQSALLADALVGGLVVGQQ